MILTSQPIRSGKVKLMVKVEKKEIVRYKPVVTINGVRIDYLQRGLTVTW